NRNGRRVRFGVGRTLTELALLVAAPALDASALHERAHGLARGGHLDGVTLEQVRLAEEHREGVRRVLPESSTPVVTGALHLSVGHPHAADLTACRDLLRPTRFARYGGERGGEDLVRETRADGAVLALAPAVDLSLHDRARVRDP